MSSIFDSLINTDFKNTFNNAIDALLLQTALTVPCKLLYSGQQNNTYCNNCIFDPISKLSANIYNSTGPVPFTENSICPVCMGMGLKTSDAYETVYLAVIFDSKYFMNITSKNTINVVDGMVQTICHTTLLPKLRNANELIVDTNIEAYGEYAYQRASDPTPVGLGDNRYIMTMWKRK
jgi:hypothetical protein